MSWKNLEKKNSSFKMQSSNTEHYDLIMSWPNMVRRNFLTGTENDILLRTVILLITDIGSTQ